MEITRFDALVHHLGTHLTRRHSLGLLGMLGVSSVIPADDAAARKGKGKRKKRKGKKKGGKKPTTTPPPTGPVAYPDARCAATLAGGASSTRLAQTFRALRSGQLTSATVFLDRNVAGTTLDIEIWSVNGAGIPDAVLAGSTVANIPSVSGPPRPLTVTFAGPATVVAGLRYAVVVTCTSGTAALAYSGGNPCPDGSGFFANSTADPLSASGSGSTDYWFETVVTA